MKFLTFQQSCVFFYITAVFADSIEEPTSNARETRRLQIRDGITFLTGLKLGSFLSRNRDYSGLTLGHGSLSTAHNFRLFGKQVNSALSFTYGDSLPNNFGGDYEGGPPLVLADDLGSENSTSTFNSSSVINSTSINVNKTNKVSHILVTYLENPSSETIDKITALIKPDFHAEQSSFVSGQVQQDTQITSNIESVSSGSVGSLKSTGIINSTTEKLGMIISSTLKPRKNSKF